LIELLSEKTLASEKRFLAFIERWHAKSS